MNIGQHVPWNAAWSAEQRYEVRQCRWAWNRPAIWQPFAQGEGKPVFAKPHNVRQRRSIFEMRCTVCGDKTPENDRWWFRLGEIREGWFMTTEGPVHQQCAHHALKVCPHLRGREEDLEPLPGGASILSSIVGGTTFENDFGIKISPHQKVIGSLKLAWRPHRIMRA